MTREYIFIQYTLNYLKMILSVAMRVGSITKLLKLRGNLCNDYQHGSLSRKKPYGN
jgi:hypothetical protein